MIVRCTYNFRVLFDPMAKNKYISGVSKFRGADQVIQKIAYYQTQQENYGSIFTVHHEDKYLGLIETPITTFLENSDIAFHRIMLFKKDGEIIWDRKNKFSII